MQKQTASMGLGPSMAPCQPQSRFYLAAHTTGGQTIHPASSHQHPLATLPSFLDADTQ